MAASRASSRGRPTLLIAARFIVGSGLSPGCSAGGSETVRTRFVEPYALEMRNATVSFLFPPTSALGRHGRLRGLLLRQGDRLWRRRVLLPDRLGRAA